MTVPGPGGASDPARLRNAPESRIPFGLILIFLLPLIVQTFGLLHLPVPALLLAALLALMLRQVRTEPALKPGTAVPC